MCLSLVQLTAEAYDCCAHTVAVTRTLEAYRFRGHFYYVTRAILVSTPNSYSEGVRYPSPF